MTGSGAARRREGDGGDGDGVDDCFEDAVEAAPALDEHDPLNKMYAEASAWSLNAEVARNPDISRKLVNELRYWAADVQVLPNAPDALLFAFLHSCYGELPRAQSAMRVFHSIRSSTPEVFSDRAYHSEEVQRALSVGHFCVLPNKTPEGYRIIVQALRNPDPSSFVYSSSSKAQFVAIDACVRADPAAAGYTFLYDMHNVQMAHMWKWGFTLPRKIFKYLQEGMPLRIQQIHFLNTTPMMDRVMRLLRPFIRNDLMNVLHFHTASNMDEFFRVVPRYCVPEDYGGTLPSVVKLSDKSNAFLERMDRLLT